MSFLVNIRVMCLSTDKRRNLSADLFVRTSYSPRQLYSSFKWLERSNQYSGRSWVRLPLENSENLFSEYFTRDHFSTYSHFIQVTISLLTSQTLFYADNRLCHSCGSNQIEDEFHLLFHRTKYCTFRDEFYKKIENQIPNITQLPPMQATKKLMNSDNYYLNTQLMKFILRCLSFIE